LFQFGPISTYIRYIFHVKIKLSVTAKFGQYPDPHLHYLDLDPH
jgi:hypothetical protein